MLFTLSIGSSWNSISESESNPEAWGLWGDEALDSSNVVSSHVEPTHLSRDYQLCSLPLNACFSEMSVEPCPSIKQNAVFATTPAEFNLTFRNQRFPVKPRRSGTRNSVDQPQAMSNRENLTELIRLRSSAFWELRRSIAENGEGFVRRMRVYEGSRSRQAIHLKVKEAEKRGRKRLSSEKRAAIHNSDDDEDIQICFGDPSSEFQNFSCCGGKGRSLHTMCVDNCQLGSSSTCDMRPCLFCGQQYSSLELEIFPPTQSTEPHSPSSIVSSSPNSPRSPHEPSSPTSPPSCGQLSLSTDDLSLPLLSTTSCHRVVAALNLALANGAGSLEDYSSLWEYQSRFQTEYYDHGDLWHWINMSIKSFPNPGPSNHIHRHQYPHYSIKIFLEPFAFAIIIPHVYQFPFLSCYFFTRSHWSAKIIPIFNLNRHRQLIHHQIDNSLLYQYNFIFQHILTWFQRFRF